MDENHDLDKSISYTSPLTQESSGSLRSSRFTNLRQNNLTPTPIKSTIQAGNANNTQADNEKLILVPLVDPLTPNKDTSSQIDSLLGRRPLLKPTTESQSGNSVLSSGTMLYADINHPIIIRDEYCNGNRDIIKNIANDQMDKVPTFRRIHRGFAVATPKGYSPLPASAEEYTTLPSSQLTGFGETKTPNVIYADPLKQRDQGPRNQDSLNPLLNRYTPNNRFPNRNKRHLNGLSEEDKRYYRQSFRKHFFTILTYLYALFLVCMGMALPIAEATTHRLQLVFDVFYVYLYAGSVFFYLYAFCCLVRFHHSTVHAPKSFRQKDFERISGPDQAKQAELASTLEENGNQKNNFGESTNQSQGDAQNPIQEQPERFAGTGTPVLPIYRVNTGSFYLRIGVLVFGAGNMIYSCLQIVDFINLTIIGGCRDYSRIIVPVLNIVFVNLQGYFIFAHSKICIQRYRVFARFGFMHIAATNFCIWLLIIARETMEGIEWYQNHMVKTGKSQSGRKTELMVNHMLGKGREIEGCSRDSNDFLQRLVDSSSPFLYPCTIEYSLICAAIICIMWLNIGVQPKVYKSINDRVSYTVNCDGSSKGLFLGVIVFVVSIVVIVLFYILIDGTDQTVAFAVDFFHGTQILIYLLCLISVCTAIYRLRTLQYTQLKSIQKLDATLLCIAVSGEYIFAAFSLLSALSITIFQKWGSNPLIQNRRAIFLLASSLLNVIECTVQTVFICDGMSRASVNDWQEDTKPGRQHITFLILCNAVLWAFNTFINSHTRNDVVQIAFYGYVTWNIITHIFTPLSIYYRYHSMACLVDIWKSAYKKHEGVYFEKTN